jgi:hypothetical protein
MKYPPVKENFRSIWCYYQPFSQWIITGCIFVEPGFKNLATTEAQFLQPMSSTRMVTASDLEDAVTQAMAPRPAQPEV